MIPILKSIKEHYEDKSGEPVIFDLTSGMYDLFHFLHLNYLQKYRARCNVLLVGVDSDDLVKQVKGPKRPIYNEIQRSGIIDGLKVVDITFIIRNLNRDFSLMSEIFNPVIFKNIHYDKVVGSEYAKNVEIIPDVNNIASTSAAIEAIISSHSDKLPNNAVSD